MTESPFPGYLTFIEAAKLKGIRRETLWKHAKAGHIDIVRLDRRRTLVVENDRFRSWEPDRQRQQDVLRGLAGRRTPRQAKATAGGTTS
jgi:hypothetical protein